MLRKKAINDFIDACRNQGWRDSAILDQIQIFVTDSPIESGNGVDYQPMQEVEILEEGEVVHPA